MSDRNSQSGLLHKLKWLVFYFRYRSFSHIFGTLAYAILSGFIMTRFPFETALRLRAFLKLGYWTDLKNPTTFNEKILHRKIYLPDDSATIIADKYLVRSFIEKAGYGEILNDLYYVTETPEDIPFDDLPDKFVVKANYGSGKNILVRDKSQLDRAALIATCREWIDKMDYELRYATEVHYKSIKPRIIIEKLLENKSGIDLLDYKMFCFDGRAEYINVHRRKYGVMIASMFSRNWEQERFTNYNKPIKMDIPKPKRLEEMLKIAGDLSRGFIFLRVDLYTIDDDQIVFGELTYNPGGGNCRFRPGKYDKEMGKLIK